MPLKCKLGIHQWSRRLPVHIYQEWTQHVKVCQSCQKEKRTWFKDADSRPQGR